MRDKLVFIAGAVWTLLFAAGLFYYPGSKLAYLIFSASFLVLLLSGFYKQASYGYMFLAVFMWLGFWLKLTAHLVLKYAYIEPIGLFDGTPMAWDAVLKISSAAGIGLIAARFVYSWCGGGNMTMIPSEECRAPHWYLPFRKLVWASLLVFVTGIAVFNAFFSIHQIGLYPGKIFPWPINSLVAWTLNIGAAMAIATLIYWDIGARQSVIAPIFAVIFEAFTSTVSIMSRGTFFYHAVPVLLGVFKNRLSLPLFPGRKVVFALIFIVLSFFSSFFIVSALRDHYYSVRSDTFAGQLTGLIVDRWVGLEGVMAVYSYPEKSVSTLIKAAAEKRTISAKPMYESVSASQYQLMDKKKHQYGSIPGAAGFFYYSGRIPVVFTGIFLLGLLVFISENIVWRATKNPLMCSLIGLAAANTVAQFGTAPRQMIPHFVMIFIAVFIIRLVEKHPQFTAGGKIVPETAVGPS
ncbi:MAG: hypothetical protein Q7R35_13015 [Elusimicrobiota bacterium]|nr:hypothetical protein [Elusimicrobiota bacterium]